MKILMVHNYYQRPGGERVAVESQVALLHEHGHKVILYTRDNVEIGDYGVWRKAAFFPRAVYSRRAYREVRAMVARDRPQVAHIHNVFPLISPSVYRALKDAGVPVVQTVHNFRFLCPNALFYTRRQVCERCVGGNTLHAIRWRCYRQSYALSALYALTIGLHRRWGTFELVDRFIALTEFSAQKLVESGFTTWDKVTVLGNFLPDPLPEPGVHGKREAYVVCVGRLSPEKGVDTLIRAMADAPRLRLRILGDGSEMHRLQALARREGLEREEFLGYVAGSRKWELMRRAVAMVVPSICYENFPLAILESFAVGTPVVASNLGSLPHIVGDEESGLLFESGDSRDLARKLSWLAAHPNEAAAMGRCGREIVETRYSARVHYERLMKIYAEVRG